MPEPGDNSGPVATRTLLPLPGAAREGDPAAWGKFVGLYTPLVYHWCVRAGLHPSEAAAAGRDVFLSVTGGLPEDSAGLDGPSLRERLRAVARRVIVGRSATLPPDPAPDADAVEKNLLYRRAVELASRDFEPGTPRAFWMLVAGRPPKDVVAELGLDPVLVYTARSRVLNRVREEFGDLLDLRPTTPGPPEERNAPAPETPR